MNFCSTLLEWLFQIVFSSDFFYYLKSAPCVCSFFIYEHILTILCQNGPPKDYRILRKRLRRYDNLGPGWHT